MYSNLKQRACGTALHTQYSKFLKWALTNEMFSLWKMIFFFQVIITCDIIYYRIRLHWESPLLCSAGNMWPVFGEQSCYCLESLVIVMTEYTKNLSSFLVLCLFFLRNKQTVLIRSKKGGKSLWVVHWFSVSFFCPVRSLSISYFLFLFIKWNYSNLVFLFWWLQLIAHENQEMFNFYRPYCDWTQSIRRQVLLDIRFSATPFLTPFLSSSFICLTHLLLPHSPPHLLCLPVSAVAFMKTRHSIMFTSSLSELHRKPHTSSRLT